MSQSIDFDLLVPFALATILETLSPGPTLGLVLVTRGLKSLSASVAVVLGIAVANIVSAIAAILVKNVEEAIVNTSVLTVLGAFYLVCISSRRVLSAVVSVVVGTEIPVENATASNAKQFMTGFLVHALNPSTWFYYGAIFATAASSASFYTKAVMAAIAVVCDLVVYLVVARWSPNLMSPGLYGRVSIRLMAGVVFFYLVVLKFSADADFGANLSLPSLTALVMLFGFLCATVAEAREWVAFRKGKNNKLLWRVVALWGICFTGYALVGSLYAAISGLERSALKLPPIVESRVRLCFAVSAILAAGLAFAKTLGELQDEEPQSIADASSAIAPGWQKHALSVATVSLLFLFAVLLLVTLTDLRLQ